MEVFMVIMCAFNLIAGVVNIGFYVRVKRLYNLFCAALAFAAAALIAFLLTVVNKGGI